MLEIDGLKKRYGDVVALDGCTFDVDPGRMLGFLGPNGAGKTTTMRSVFGLVSLDSGEVRWDGRPPDADTRRRFGYMPEQRGLYQKMRIRDQITYFGRLHGMSKPEAREAADRWLTDLGLAERLDEPLENLSHGNQQRVQLAAALVHHPDLLILDEPFSGLDPIGADTMAEVLRRRASEGATVVFSSHQLDVVEDLCEDVVIINQGKIVLAGNVEELKRRSPYRVLELDLTDEQFLQATAAPGVVASRFDGRHHILTVERGTDLRLLLSHLEQGDEVDHLVFTTPSLTDLFREAVS